MNFIAALASAILLSACSTPYQEMGLAGGVTAQQMTANTYRIVSRGNSYTQRTSIQDYTLLKAAETTRQAGCTHFAIISAADASTTVHTTGSLNTTFVGDMAMTTYDPPEKRVRPGQDTYIRVLCLQPGQQAHEGAFRADEIIEYVGSRVKRPNA